MPTTTMDCQTASGLDGGASSSVAASHSKPSHETNQPAPRCAQTKDATANGTVVRDTSNDAASPGQPQDVVVNATTTTGMVGNSDNNKAAKKNKKNKSKKSSKSGVAEKKHENYSGNQVPKAKNAAEELTLFQNSNLLNQRDPLEHLQQQLNQLILDDAGANGRFGVNRPQNNNIDPDKSLDQHKSTNLTSLSLESSQNYPQEPCALEYNVSSNMHTVKKGVLWLQQDHDKFHQRLFSRWKKRFFILTTDYLVCFKRSKSKVGRSTIRSAMGQFRWKASLGDILEIEWLRPKRSDKGAIILRMRNQFNLFLWSKDNLDEWMALIDSTRLKRRLRGGLAEGNSQVTMASNQNGIYENALLPAVRDGPLYNQTTIAPTANIDPLLLKQSSTGDALLLAQQSIISQTSEQNKENVIAAALIDPSAEGHFNHGLIEREHQMNGNQQQMDDSCGNNVAFHGGGSDAQATKLGSQRPHASMINDDDAPAKDEASKKERDQQQNLSSDDLLTSEKKRAQASKHSRDQSGHNGPSASASVSSTPRSTSVRQNQLGEGEKLEKNSCESASTNQTICRDSNDNLVPPMGAKSKREIAECADRANGSVLRLEEARDECHMESAAVTVLDERIATTTADKQSSKLHKSDADDDDDAVVNGTNQREDHHQMSEVERVEPSQRIEGRRSVKPERPVSNLIRRDDSWHSSLSLNQVGNNHMQAAAAAAVAAKRSLYTQNITTTSTATGQPSGKIGSGHFQQHSNINSVEATATPLRGRPPIRQQSMQLHNNRRLPPFGQLQTNSFDAAQIPSSPSQHYNNQQQQQQQQQLRQLQHPPTSYHQKLLQLQLLHNSNNIDYVRTNIELNNGYRTSNDYQIYGPGSIATTNHYGYYSMRSNLKSAASEFSFIRPNSSDFHPAGPAALLPQQQQQQQPSQAHQSEFSSGDILNQVQQHNNNRASLVLAANNHQLLDYENGMAGSPSSRGQYLTQNGLGNIRVTPGEHGVNNQYHKGLNGLNDLATAPNRDLPLKPNKKRQQLTGNGAQTQKNFGSSIVHFFRRAFSKRSKRRPKLATESCSSSLGGALDDKFESIQRTRSAFSTTEGTRIDRNEISDQQQSLITQRHRMIDLIEAFSNKTAIDQETYNKLAQQNCIDSIELDHQREPIQHEPSMQTKLAQQYRPQHLIGSPLHKSNSVSTSTGLSGLNEMMRLNERQMLLNNSQQSPAIGGPRNGAMSSPMVNRSTKVLSANLTPLYSRKETQEHHHEAAARYFASPRCSTNLEHLPRPSSIYGQPSMISSPVFSNSRDHRGASGSAGGDFGSHRSSIHSYHQRGSEREPINSSIDLRRHHQTIKAPFLDTTREVAEEVSSPTTETKAFIDYEAQQGGNCKQLLTDECRNSGPTTNNEMTPKNYSIRQQQQHQRRAIVNPILQSPTMSLIYDNHPMPINNGSSSNGAYSHYDNHRPIEYQQSMSSMDLSVHSYPQSINPASVDHQEELHHRTTNINNSNAIISPLAASRNLKMRQSFNLSGHTTSGLVTPSHRNMRLSQQQQQQQSNSIAPYQQELDRNLLEHAKPAAMIAPSTPTSHQLRGQEPSYALPRVVTESTSTGHFNPYSQSCSSRPNSMIKPSPIKAPQHQPTNSHYQQSPLVNRQTRVVKRGDGVQTTVIHPEVFALNGQEESVVNIVGAPGVNLEPSLAHSILRGTNINAFESSASAGLHMNSNRANANTKTFLVSSRLSKTINESPSNIGGVSNAKRNRMVPESDARLERERSKEDESLSRSTSSGTEPSSSSTTSSARSDSSARRRGTNENSVKSFQTEKVLDSGRDKKVGQRKESSGGGRSSGDSNRRRGSSTEHSDELSSQAESFDEPPPEGRKWVTSKLVQ